MNYLALLAILPLMACTVSADASDETGTPGSGTGNARSYAVADFSSVSLRGSDDVDVRVGSAFSVRAEGAADQLDQLVIDKKGDTLRIGRKSSNGINWGRGEKIRVYVTMPRIAEASVAGSGDLNVDRAEGSTFSGSTAGSGDLKVAALAVETATLRVAGSGTVSAAGTASAINVKVAGSGDVDAQRLTATSASVSVAGSGNVSAVVNGKASVSIVGSGNVNLGPKAQCSTSKTGSGSVTCG